MLKPRCRGTTQTIIEVCCGYAKAAGLVGSLVLVFATVGCSSMRLASPAVLVGSDRAGAPYLDERPITQHDLFAGSTRAPTVASDVASHGE